MGIPCLVYNQYYMSDGIILKSHTHLDSCYRYLVRSVSDNITNLNLKNVCIHIFSLSQSYNHVMTPWQFLPYFTPTNCSVCHSFLLSMAFNESNHSNKSDVSDRIIDVLLFTFYSFYIQG